jgi:hypothetical protein
MSEPAAERVKQAAGPERPLTATLSRRGAESWPIIAHPLLSPSSGRNQRDYSISLSEKRVNDLAQKEHGANMDIYSSDLISLQITSCKLLPTDFM